MLAAGTFFWNSPLWAQAPPTPVKLVFLTQPRNAAVGKRIQPAIRVAALDAKGGIAANSAMNVSLSLASDPSHGATLSGVLAHRAVRGIATFAGLSLDAPGRGYTFRATGAISGSVLSAVSHPFNSYVDTSVSLQSRPSEPSYGDRAILVASVSPCQDDYGGTAGQIQVWLAKEVLATAPVSGILAGCQARLPVTFAGPRFPAGTYRLTAAFLSSNPNYGFSSRVRELSLEPRRITAAYAGDSLVVAAGAKALVNLRVQVSPASGEAGPATGKHGTTDIFDRLNKGAERVVADFFDCSSAPCKLLGRAPVRDSAGTNGAGVATLAVNLPVGAFALTFRVRQTRPYFASAETPAGQKIVATAESAVAVAAGTGLRGAGWVPDAKSINGKGRFAFSIHRNRHGTLAGDLAAIYPGFYEGVPVDVVVWSESPVRLDFLDRERNEVELTARASAALLDRTTGNAVGGFAAPATPNLTMVVVANKVPQFGLDVLDAQGKPFANFGMLLGNLPVPLPAGGARIFLSPHF